MRFWPLVLLMGCVPQPEVLPGSGYRPPEVLQVREIAIVQDVSGSVTDNLGAFREMVLELLDHLLANPRDGDHFAMTTFVGGVEPEAWIELTSLVRDGEAVADQVATLAPCNCGAPYSDSVCFNTFGGADLTPWMIDCFAFGTHTSPAPGIDQAVDELLLGA